MVRPDGLLRHRVRVPDSLANQMSITVSIVVSRRTFLVGSSGMVLVGGVGALVATDRLDDTLRTVGVKPHPEPDPGDLRLAARARADTEALLVLATSAQAPPDVLAALQAHRSAVPSSLPDASAVSGDLAAACLAVADARAADAVAAISTDLAQVLASIAASLAQCAVRVSAP
jgi:hypothetical protein